jgi:hypothetical protein
MLVTVDRIPPRPGWGALYALTGSMLGLVGVVDVFVPTEAWQRTLEVVVTILTFGSIYLWVRANRRALDLAGARNAGFRTIIITPDTEASTFDRDTEQQVTDVRDRKNATRQGGAHRSITALPRR